MGAVTGMVLRGGTGLVIFLYVLFPVETTTWLVDHLRVRTGSFCQTASPSRFALNKGQCNGAVKKTSDAELDDLWVNIRAVLTQRAAR